MAWGNETHMRPVIARRRARCVAMRLAGDKWKQIRDALGYGSLQHARIDYLRATERK